MKIFVAAVMVVVWILACLALFQIIEIRSKTEAASLKDTKILISILEEEKANLGIKSPVSFEIDNKIETCRVIKNCKDGFCSYQVKANRIWASRPCIRHELYHIYKDHFVETNSVFVIFSHVMLTFFWYEPTANFYAIFG